MYTLMLMTSLSASPDTAEFNGFFRDLFHRNGCQGSCTGSTGSSNRNASCSGSSCHGNFLGIMDRVRSMFRGNSCNGTSRSQGCHGSSSSSGSCTGSGYGCFGSTYNNDGTWVDPYNPYGSPGIYTQPPPNIIPGEAIPFESAPNGGWTPSAPLNVEPAQPAPAIPPQSVPDAPSHGTSQFYKQSIQATPDRAEVEVLLPTDAVLYAESQRLRLTSDRRVFVSPPLQSGQRYEYAFRVEYVRNGETITRSRSVQIQAGTKERLDFSESEFAKKEEPATVPKPDSTAMQPVSYQAPSMSVDRRAYLKIRIPEGATLEVDGRDSGQTGTLQEFRTPSLPENKDYSYEVRATWNRDGHPESKTTQIVFRPGETRMIDLTKGPGSR